MGNTDELRKRVEEAEAQLREEAKIIERMTRDNKSKQEQINSMEAVLQREVEKHQATIHMLEDEHLTQKLQADHDIEVLNRKVSELELHVEAYDVVESANVALRGRVDKLMLQLERENKNHAEEIHKVRLDMFNHKMALEKTFRKSLQELDADYLKKAFNAMSEESKNALVANAKLKDELQLQSIGVDNLMQRFSQQAKHYQKMKAENEILEQESHLRLQEVSSMKKAQVVASRTIEKLKDEVVREEQEWKDQANKIVEELRQENMHLLKLYESGQKRCSKWKARCLELTEREAQRRMEEQRAQSAPTSVRPSWHPIPRTQSQSALAQDSAPGSVRVEVPVNYDEMWSASLIKNSSSIQRPPVVDLVKSKKAAGFVDSPSGDLERIAAATLEIRPRTALPRPPDAALIRARAKAPLRNLQALHLSSAGVECVRHLELCRHALRSLYADDNRLRDIEGVLVLRRLWRIDLNDNLLCHGLHKQQQQTQTPQKSLLAPLASFAALGFLYLERNQLHFGDLVCLRDVHIMELRLQANPALMQDCSGVVEYRMKVVALLPNVWILDGHYISTAERERAIDEQDSFVQYLLANVNASSNESDAEVYGKFGSTAELWGGVVSEDSGDEHGWHEQSENASRLIEHIHTQRACSAELTDRNRMLTVVALHNEECAVHNRHCKFAPSKFSPNARAMPRIYLQELLALPHQTGLEIAATLGAYLEFGFARALLAEALTIQLLECDTLPANAAEELASLPPYALSALLCIMRHQALEEESNARQELRHRASPPELESESLLWTSMPPLFTTLLGFDKDTHHLAERTELRFATQCHFVVGLLSRAASFPDDILELRSERKSGKDASASKSLAELLPLVQISKMVSNYNESATSRSDEEEPSPLMGSWISGDAAAAAAIRITDIRREKTDRLPWETKSLEREYPRPWDQATNALSTSLSASALNSAYSEHSDNSNSQQNVKRKPRAGEWLEIKPKQFLKIRQLSEDGSHVVVFSPTESSSSFTIHVDQLSRVSSSLWRLVDSELSQQLFEKCPRSSPLVAGKLGKLHRESEGFHRHGAARSQGFPNHFVTSEDLQEMERVASDNQQPQSSSDRVAQPVALFCSTDTIDSNFVLAPPQMVSAQNCRAIKNFRELGQSPAGLWSPIKQAPFAMLAAGTSSAARSQSMKSLVSTGNLLVDAKAPRSRKPPSLQQDPVETESEWAVLQREMESVLRIKPRQSATQSPSPSPADGTPRTNHDVLCFMAAVPSQDGGSGDASDPAMTSTDDNTPRLSTPPYPQSRKTQLSSSRETSVGSPSTTRAVSTQQSRLRLPPGAEAAPSWHRVSTKPQLLVASHSVPSLGRTPSSHALSSPSQAKPRTLVQSYATSSNAGTPRTYSASRAPLKLQHCNVVLPTITQKW